ncbi:MAG: ABC transporter permease [Spirochaetia bacterium]|jgi:osmoprotectant transport system permease protein|nr:ABC transporter permease [Spirochaetia bacterium]
MWIQAWNYLLNHPDKILGWTLQHLYIILVANVAAAIIGILIGIYISGKGREHIAETVIYFASIMMTIPSLALYGILMGILSLLSLPSIGFLPVVIALTLYGLLPIIRNTYAAIREVDPAMIEAGRGMGMSEKQILTKVKLPLAVPIIMAGLRQAVVMNIGIAAIGSYIGAGGLGQPIFRGIANYRTDLILIGAICVSLLSIIVDMIMGRLEWLTTPKGVRIRRNQ